MLAVVCELVQQLLTVRAPAVHRGKGTTHKTNVGRAVQIDPTLLRQASAITEQKKCLKSLALKFDHFQPLLNNMQKHVTGCANGRKIKHPTMCCWPTNMRPFARGR